MNKIIPFNNLKKFIKQQALKKIILVGGCFDILHPSHVDFLNKSKQLGGALMILLESDEKVKKLKGKRRPIFPQIDRAKILANLTCVDYVVLLPILKKDEEYFELVKTIKPAIIAITKSDGLKKLKKEQAEIVGGKLVEVIKRKEKHSTSNIVKKIIDL